MKKAGSRLKQRAVEVWAGFDKGATVQGAVWVAAEWAQEGAQPLRLKTRPPAVTAALPAA